MHFSCCVWKVPLVPCWSEPELHSADAEVSRPGPATSNAATFSAGVLVSRNVPAAAQSLACSHKARASERQRGLCECEARCLIHLLAEQTLSFEDHVPDDENECRAGRGMGE